MFKVQVLVLVDTTRQHQPTARHAMRGRVWSTIATHKRLSVAEQVLRRVRTDWPTPIVRIRPVSA